MIVPIKKLIPKPAPRAELFLRNCKHLAKPTRTEVCLLQAACFNYPRVPASAIRTGDGELRVHFGTEV